MTPIRRRPPRFEPGTVSLLAEILANQPNLTDAACRGAWRLVDEALYPEQHADPSAARAHLTTLCATCPASTRCADSLSQERASQ